MSYIRTPEHRAMRSEMTKRWKPWEKSTGPRTEEGKRKSAKRGYKGDLRRQLMELSRILKESNRCDGSALRSESTLTKVKLFGDV